MFTWIHKNDWFEKKTTFVRSGKVETISTLQRNRDFRKVSVNKTFIHVQEQKKAMSPRHSAYIPFIVKSPYAIAKSGQINWLYLFIAKIRSYKDKKFLVENSEITEVNELKNIYITIFRFFECKKIFFHIYNLKFKRQN